MRCELQRRRNLECDPENHRNERGWYVPHLVWEGWGEFNRGCYSLWRYMIIRRHANETERSYALRDAHWALQSSQACERPRIP